MPAKGIDRSPFPEMTEGVLRRGFPSLALKLGDHGLDHGRVALVAQLVHLRVAPAERDDRRHPKSPTYRPERGHGHALELAALQPRDRLAANAGPAGHVHLAETASLPELTDHTADLEVVAHGPTMATGALWLLIWVSSNEPPQSAGSNPCPRLLDPNEEPL